MVRAGREAAHHDLHAGIVEAGMQERAGKHGEAPLRGAGSEDAEGVPVDIPDLDRCLDGSIPTGQGLGRDAERRELPSCVVIKGGDRRRIGAAGPVVGERLRRPGQFPWRAACPAIASL